MSPIEPLSEDLKKALDEAQWPEAPADLEARQLPVLTAAWSAMAAAAPAPVPSPAGGGLRRLFGSMGVWSTAAALVVGGAGGAWLHRELTSPPTVPVVAPLPAAPPPTVAPPEPQPSEIVPTEVSPPPEPTPQREREREREQPRRVTPVAAPAPSTLEAEQQLLDTARTAFLRREPERAMPVLDEYARKFPRGALSEEHDALRIQGLCLLGRGAQATELARVFRQRHPNSVFLETVELSLKSLARPADSGPTE